MLDYFENKQMPISQGLLCQGPESGDRPCHPHPPFPASFLVCVNLWNSFYFYDPPKRPLSGEQAVLFCMRSLYAVSTTPFGDAGAGLGDMVPQEETWFLSRSQVPEAEVSPSRPCTCHLPICQASWAHLSLPREVGNI